MLQHANVLEPPVVRFVESLISLSSLATPYHLRRQHLVLQQ